MIPLKVLLAKKTSESPVVAGSLYSWGENTYGQLGLSTQSISKSTTDIDNPEYIGAPTWDEISIGYSHAAAIKNGSLYVWGAGDVGQLGLGESFSPSQSPVFISASWTQIAAVPSELKFYGLGVNFGIKSDGSLWAWGQEIQTTNPAASGLFGAQYFKSLAPVKVDNQSWSFVSTGIVDDNYYEFDYQVVAAVRSDGALFTWGENYNGELGDGTTVGKSSPVRVGLDSWKKVYINRWNPGTSFSGLVVIGIKSDDTLYEWGRSTFATNGGGSYYTAVNRSSPVQIGSTVSAGFKDIDIAYDISNVNPGGPTLYALGKDGHIYMSGSVSGDYFDGLKYGRDTPSPVAAITYSSPVQVGTSSWTYIASTGAEAYYSAAIRSDGALFTWGWNSWGLGVLGDGTTIDRSSPVQIGTSSWTKVSITAYSTAAIRSDGALFAWGTNDYGTFGDGTTISSYSPIQIGSDTWIDISINNAYDTYEGTGSFAIRSDGALFAWGGELFAGGGEYTGVLLSSPVQIGTDSWSSVSSGSEHVLAIKSDGTLWSWGYQYNGELGLNDNYINYSSPTQIGTDSWSQVSAAGSFSAAIRSDGTLFTWGRNNSGQLGDGTLVDKSSPVQIGTDSWIFVNAASYDSIRAIRADGMLFIWGADSNGALGVGNPNDVINSPVMLGSESWSMVGTRTVYAGPPTYDFNYMTQGIRSDGTLYSWGWDLHGDAGLGTGPITYNSINLSSNYKLDNQSWIALSSDGSVTLAVRDDGALFGWGQNYSGQLGDGTTIDVSSPVQIGSSSWINVDVQNAQSFAIRSDGALFAWGVNDTWKLPLGIQPGTDLSSPVQIGSSSWSSVSAGYPHFAISENGSLYGWPTQEEVISVGPYVGINYLRQSPTLLDSNSWTKVECGISHTIAIRSDGLLFAWGSNEVGQLGDGSTTYASSPVQIGTSSWSSISAYEYYTAAVRSDGALFTWGWDSFGQVGSGFINSFRSSPVQVPSKSNYIGNITYDQTGASSPVQIGSSSWTMAAAGYSRAAAVRSDGGLFTWGWNENGQLGNGTTDERSSPTKIGSSSWTSVDIGYIHAAAIRSDGALFAWGFNGNGQLGDDTTVTKSSPVLVKTGIYLALSSPVQVGSSSWNLTSSGLEYGQAIASDGGLYFWGWDSNGLAGLNSKYLTYSSPVKVGTSSWSSVVSGHSHSAAIRSDGALFLWGANNFGQLGTDSSGVSSYASSPVQIGTSSWSQVSIGVYHTAAIRNDGALFVWGSNAYGQLGDSSLSTDHKSSPIQIGTSSWSSVSAGVWHTAAIRNDGGLFTWGINIAGALGDGTTVQKSSPVKIGSSSWNKVSAGQTYTVAIRSDGALFAWGFNGSGRLGDGTALSRSSPVQIGTSSWTSIAAGAEQTAAIRSDGALFAWGFNEYGTLGDNTRTSKSSPVKIGSSSWTSVSVGKYTNTVSLPYGNFMSAVRSDGALFTWGDRGELYSQLGIIQEGVVNSWSMVSVNLDTAGGHTIGVTTDGSLYTWGYNVNGEIGDGDRRSYTFKKVPIKLGSSSWTKVSAGIGFDGAIRSDGALFTWGLNTTGQLGYLGSPNFTRTSSPAQVGASSWIVISCSDAYAAAITADNRLFTWGKNASGQLGDGTTVDNGASTILIGTSSWSLVSAGRSHAAAIRIDGALFAWGDNSEGQLGDGTSISRSSPIQIGTSSWINVIAGYNFTAAVREDGKLFTWGSDGYGSLGVYYFEPGSWNKVSAGAKTLIGIDSNNDLYIWGYRINMYNVRKELNAYLIDSNLNWQDISAGRGKTNIGTIFDADYHRAITSDNKLYHWGTFTEGTSAIYDQFISPVTVLSGQSWTVASSSGYNEAAINNIGELYTFGQVDGYGETGRMPDNFERMIVSPEQFGSKVPTYFESESLNSWNSVSSGLYTTYAIRSDNLLYSWGRNNYGQLGDGTTQNRSQPTLIGNNLYWTFVDGESAYYTAGLLSDGSLYTINSTNIKRFGFISWAQLSAGSSFLSSVYLGIRSDGALFAWGDNTSGQLGDGTTVNRSSPVQIGTSSWTKVSIDQGSQSAAAIRSDGALFRWGRGANGRLGDGTTISKSSPVQIGSSSWTNVDISWSHSMAIRSDGALFTWGAGTSGILGDGTTTSKSSPVQLGTSSWSSVSAGTIHSAAVRSDGALFTWGNNSNGVLGDGTTVDKSSPVQIGTSSWNFVSVSGYHSAAVRSDGGLFTWGLNHLGQLGNGTTVSKSSPIQIGTSSWSSVSAGYSHVLGIKTDGSLYYWGNYTPDNFSNIYRSSPTQVGTITNTDQLRSWNMVSGGESFAAAITSTGSLWAWGFNTSGQVGDGTTINKSSPVQLGTSSWSSVSSGFDHAVAIRSDGALFAWGKNSAGQLGDGTTGPQSSPVQIGSSSWSYVSAGKSMTTAIRSDGSLFVWGDNSYGYVGDGTTSSKSSPVQIGTSSWTMVNAGHYYSAAFSINKSYVAALRSDNKFFAWGRFVPDGTAVAKSSPVQIGTKTWDYVGRSIAIDSQGALFKTDAFDPYNTTDYTPFICLSDPYLATCSWTMLDSGSYYGIANNEKLYKWKGWQIPNSSTFRHIFPTLVEGSSWTNVSGSALTGNNAIAIKAQ